MGIKLNAEQRFQAKLLRKTKSKRNHRHQHEFHTEGAQLGFKLGTIELLDNNHSIINYMDNSNLKQATK